MRFLLDRTGGIVPTVAEELHRKYLEPLTDDALRSAQCTYKVMIHHLSVMHCLFLFVISVINQIINNYVVKHAVTQDWTEYPFSKMFFHLHTYIHIHTHTHTHTLIIYYTLSLGHIGDCIHYWSRFTIVTGCRATPCQNHIDQGGVC